MAARARVPAAAPTVVDWARTRAFAYGIFGNVVLNVAGRERAGIVEPGEEYERLRDELRERLLDLRSRDGEPIVAAVHRREDLFAGPELDKIPDLVVEFRDYAWLGKGNLTERTPTLEDAISIRAHPDQRYAGGHRQDGIFVLAGPGARAGAELAGAGIADVAPTVMYLLGEPFPPPSRGGCWPRRSSRRCSTSGRRSSTTTKKLPRSSRSTRARARSRSGSVASATSSSRALAQVGRRSPRASPAERAGRRAASRRLRRGALGTSSTSVKQPRFRSRCARMEAGGRPQPRRAAAGAARRPAACLPPTHGQDRADACVRDDDARPADRARSELRRRGSRATSRTVGGGRSRPALHDELLVPQPVERRAADGRRDSACVPRVTKITRGRRRCRE